MLFSAPLRLCAKKKKKKKKAVSRRDAGTQRKDVRTKTFRIYSLPLTNPTILHSERNAFPKMPFSVPPREKKRDYPCESARKKKRSL